MPSRPVSSSWVPPSLCGPVPAAAAPSDSAAWPRNARSRPQFRGPSRETAFPADLPALSKPVTTASATLDAHELDDRHLRPRPHPRRGRPAAPPTPDLRRLDHRLFEAAGIGPGCVCSTSAAALGDVCATVAELVGPSGEVVGVEVAPSTMPSHATSDGRRRSQRPLRGGRSLRLDRRWRVRPGRRPVGLDDVPDPVGCSGDRAIYLRPGAPSPFRRSTCERPTAVSRGPFTSAVDSHAPAGRGRRPRPADRPSSTGAYSSRVAGPETAAHTPVGGGSPARLRVPRGDRQEPAAGIRGDGDFTADEVDIHSLEERLRDETWRTTTEPRVTVYGACTAPSDPRPRIGACRTEVASSSGGDDQRQPSPGATSRSTVSSRWAL